MLTGSVLEWSEHRVGALHGHMSLSDAELSRSGDALELSRKGERLIMRGESLQEWEESLRCALQAVAEASSAVVDSLKADKVGLERQVKFAKEETASLRQRVKELEEGRADLLLRAESAEEEASSLRRRVNELEDTPAPTGGNAAAPAKIGLADLVTKAQAQARSVSDAQEQHSKFSEATFTLAYTGRSTFFGGLESLIGLPTPNLRMAMEAEHCASADSQDEFTTSNYGITTTPEVEWHAVVDPHAGLAALKRKEYPSETYGATGEHMRKLKPLDKFLPALERTNASLRKLGEPTVCEEELLSGRLYTGPMVRAKCRCAHTHPLLLSDLRPAPTSLHCAVACLPASPSLCPTPYSLHTPAPIYSLTPWPRACMPKTAHTALVRSSKSTTSSAAPPSKRRHSS